MSRQAQDVSASALPREEDCREQPPPAEPMPEPMVEEGARADQVSSNPRCEASKQCVPLACEALACPDAALSASSGSFRQSDWLGAVERFRRRSPTASVWLSGPRIVCWREPFPVSPAPHGVGPPNSPTTEGPAPPLYRTLKSRSVPSHQTFCFSSNGSIRSPVVQPSYATAACAVPSNILESSRSRKYHTYQLLNHTQRDGAARSS